MAGQMSAFEFECWSWYMENVNQLMLESGAAGMEICRAVRMLKSGPAMLFKRALNAMYQSFAKIEAERREKARKEHSS